MGAGGIGRTYLKSFDFCHHNVRQSTDLSPSGLISSLLYHGPVNRLWHGDRKNHDLTGGYDPARDDSMRVCTQPDDQTATEIERITSERGISKSQFLLEALNHFMSCKGQKPDASTVEALKAGYDQAVSLAEQRQRDIDGLKAEIDRLKTSLEAASSKAAKAEEQLVLTRSDADKVYGEIASLSKELQEAQSKAEKEVVEKNQAQHETAKANEGVQGLRADLEHSRGVIKLKDDEIGFLRATIHQLSDKIPRALPMSEEEARARQWWKFW